MGQFFGYLLHLVLGILIPATSASVITPEVPAHEDKIRKIFTTPSVPIMPSLIPLPSSTVVPTNTPVPTEIPQIFLQTEIVHFFTSPSITPTVTPSPTPLPTDTPEPTLTHTPSPTPGPVSPTAVPTRMTFPAATSGELDGWFDRYAGEYVIDRQRFWLVAVCESGLNANARNGDYGGMFQFATRTWITTRAGMGMDTNPDLRFNPEEAIRTAAFKISLGGFGPWPTCGR